jgi:nicotinamide-nucleotide amidase
MQAEIISIGDELLIGQVVNTNASWMAQQLNLIGISVFQITAIGDTTEHILQALQEAESRSNLILLTGGLGPTSDDITKPALCEYFNSKLIVDESVAKHLTDLLQKRGIRAMERNLKQAEVPDNCKVIHNPVGTAPGMWFEKNDKVFVSLPGVPYEMETIMNIAIIPLVKEFFKTPTIVHKTIQTFGIPESMLADKLISWEKQLPDDLKLAYLPSPEGIRLRLSIKGENKDDLEKLIDHQVNELNKIIPADIFGYDKQSLQEVIGIILKKGNKTLSTAESCTGGLIAKLITEIPGSSNYFTGSVVAYSNKIKEDVLKVNPENIKNYGAVSQQVVEEMVKGALHLFGTDYAIATSGIAGPDGGTEDKPVGTVWIAVGSAERIIAKRYVFGNLRDINIRRSSSTALNMLRRFIEGTL